MNEFIRSHRISVEQYYKMGEVGILSQDERLELIDGHIIDLEERGPVHASAVMELHRMLWNVEGDRAGVRVHLPIRLSNNSEPLPDITLVKRCADEYKTKHPGASDTMLLIEVSDRELRYDLEVKVPLYARYAIPEVWIIDVHACEVWTFWSPKSGRYIDIVTREPGILSPTQLPDVQIDLGQVAALQPSFDPLIQAISQ